MRNTKYSPRQINDWSNLLGQVANWINWANAQLARHFYAVHYAIGLGAEEEDLDSLERSPAYDPFKLEESVVAEFGGLERFIDSLMIVIASGGDYIRTGIWDYNDGLKEYLRRLLQRLTAKQGSEAPKLAPVFFGNKKERALMIVMQMMIARYQNIHADNLDEGIFRLFEMAKAVRRAETEEDFRAIIRDL